MTNQLTRRALCAALPALGLSTALPAHALGPADNQPNDTEYLGLYREFLSVHDACRASMEGSPCDHGIVLSRLPDRYETLLVRLDAMSPNTKQGLAALVHVQWIEEGPREKAGSDAWLQEVERPEHVRTANLWRKITGLNGLPRRLT